MDFETKHDDATTTTYETGAKRSDRTGKGRFDLIPPHSLTRLAKVYERGAITKGSNNWMKGMEFSRCIDSALRHLNQYRMGMVDEDHIGHACFNLFAIMHFQETNTGTDDITKQDAKLL